MKTLLLDAGGTIVFPNFRHIAVELARDGIRVDPEVIRHTEVRVRFEFDRPEIVLAGTDAQRWVRYLKNLFRAVGVKDSRKSMRVIRRLKKHHELNNLWDFVPEDVPHALETLRKRFRLGVVSNANGTARALLTRLKLARHFEVIVDSQEERIEKPDPRLFHIALGRMKAPASQTAYVGDFYHIDVVGARKAGLKPFLLDPLGLYAGRRVSRVKSLLEIVDQNW